MEAKFKVGDYIRHKDKEKADKLFLQGKIVNICKSDRGVDFYLLRPELAVLVENQDDYELVP